MKNEKNINPQSEMNQDTNKSGQLNKTVTRGNKNESPNQDPDRKVPEEPGKETWKNPDPTSPEKERKDPYAGGKDLNEDRQNQDELDTERDPQAKTSETPGNTSKDQGRRGTDMERDSQIEDPDVNNNPNKETRI